jgi:hypothetical protein
MKRKGDKGIQKDLSFSCEIELRITIITNTRAISAHQKKSIGGTT